MPHRIDATLTLTPALWYHQHVVTGAQEHALPPSYQQMLSGLAARIPSPTPTDMR